MTRALTDYEQSLLDSGVALSRLLPMRAADTGGRITELTLYCKHCDSAIADERTNAVCREPLAGVYDVEALGVCWDCRVATPLRLRLMRDGRLEGPSPHTGRWVSWAFLTRSAMRRPWWDLLGHLRVAARRVSATATGKGS